MWESCSPLRTVHKFRVVIKVWSTQLYCWSKEGDRFWHFFLTNERTKKDTPDSSPAQNKKLNLWWFSPTARGKPQTCTFIYWWCIYNLLQKYTWKYTVQPILNGHPPGNGSNIAPITSAILPKLQVTGVFPHFLQSTTKYLTCLYSQRYWLCPTSS